MDDRRTAPEHSLRPLDLAVVAHGIACLAPADMDLLRRLPFAGLPATLVPQLLKHSDEQTFAALVALRRALAGSPLAGTDFGRWGVVSSSRYLGRSPFAAVLDKYKIDGPWGVSVQVIPHRMPHSVPGTLSLALMNHGPSISVGGGPDDQTSTLLSMAGLLGQGKFPGVWLVVSGWWPELTIEINGQPTSDSKCMAAVLGVVPAPVAKTAGSIRFAPAGHLPTAVQGNAAENSTAQGAAKPPASDFRLADFLLADGAPPRRWQCQFANGLEITVDLERPAAPIVGVADILEQDGAGPPVVPPPHKRPSATGSRIKRGR